jgi:hypothetical protein
MVSDLGGDFAMLAPTARRVEQGFGYAPVEQLPARQADLFQN